MPVFYNVVSLHDGKFHAIRVTEMEAASSGETEGRFGYCASGLTDSGMCGLKIGDDYYGQRGRKSFAFVSL